MIVKFARLSKFSKFFVGKIKNIRKLMFDLGLVLLIFFLVSNSFYNVRLARAIDAPPEPFITCPRNDEFLCSLDPFITKIYGNSTQIRAVDLTGEGDIQNATFEYSPNGIDWMFIGKDLYGGFQGIDFTVNSWGGTGWNATWETTAIGEGVYLLRVTMIDAVGQSGSSEIMVHYDPTPPLPDLYTPYFLQVINGVRHFNATSPDEDVMMMSLEYLNASRPGFNQNGLGDADQEDVGPEACAPTAAANAIWRLGQLDPELNEKPDGTQYDNATELAKDLADKMKTNENGTASDQVTDALRKYVNGTGWGVKVSGPRKKGGVWSYQPLWDLDIGAAIADGEAVIVLKVQPGADGQVGTPDDIGHYETGKDVNFVTEKLSFRDPKGPAGGPVDVEGKAGPNNVPNNNGFEGVWIDYDNDGEQDANEVWYLFMYWEISPYPYSPFFPHIPVEHTYVSNPDGSWSIPWNTSGVHDGFFVIRIHMTDATSNIGMARSLAYINNNEPNPVVLETPTPDNITANSVALSWTENSDDDFGAYEVYVSEIQGYIGDLVQTIENWTTSTSSVGDLLPNTTYYITVRVLDLAGLYSDSNQVEAKTEYALFADVNGDGKVDITDISLVIGGYGTTPLSPDWNSILDLNNDEKVDITDIYLVISHYGDHLTG